MKEEDIQITFMGNKTLISKKVLPLTAFYCSRNMPIPVFYDALKLFENMIKEEVIFIGGWQSPIEKRFLKWFGENYKYSRGLIWVIGKDIRYFRLYNYLKNAFNAEKLLIVSLFKGIRRITKKEVNIRDEFIMNNVEQSVFFYIFPGARLESISRQWVKKDKRVFVFENSPIPEYIKNKVKTIGVNANFEMKRRYNEK